MDGQVPASKGRTVRTALAWHPWQSDDMDTTIRIEFAPALMTREIAAYYLSMSTRELDLLKNRGVITAYGNSKRVKFKKTDLDDYIERLPERHN